MISSDHNTIEKEPSISALLELGLSSASCGVLVCAVLQPNFPIVYANDGFLSLAGCARNQVLGRDLLFLQASGTDLEAVHAVTAALHAGREHRQTILLTSGSGSRFWAELDLVPVAARSKGAATHFLVIVRDVTQRVKSEDELRRREGELWQILDLVPHFIFSKDANGRFLLVNQAVAEAMGTTVSELIGKSDGDFLQSAEEVQHFQKDDLEVIRTGQLKQIEERITTARGEVRHLQTTKIPFIPTGSALPAILGVSTDITARKQAEDARHKTELVVQRIFESPMVGIVFWNTEGEISEANYAFLSMVKYSREDLACGRVNWLTMTPPEYREVDRKAHQELEQHGFCSPFEKEYIRSDGSRVPVLIASSRIERGSQRGISLVLDLTEQSRSEQALRESERERELFSRLGFELAAAETVEKIAQVVKRTVEEFWNWDSFFLSARKSGHARFRMVLKIDTVEGTRIEEGRLSFYEAGSGPELDRLYAGEPVLINRDAPGQTPLRLFGDKKRPSSSLMYAPMRSGRHIQGILSVQSYATGRFSSADLDRLQHIADAAAPALERSRAEMKASAFLRLGETLSQTTTPVEAAQTILSAADELVGWDVSVLYLYSEREDKAYPLVVVDVLDGVRTEITTGPADLVPHGNLRKVVDSGEPLLILRQSPPSPGEYAGMGDEERPSASIIWVPIRTSAGLIGLFSVQSYTRNAYDAEDLETLQALAGHCAGALERTQAQQILKEREERYRHAITETGAVPYQLDYATKRYLFIGEGIERLTGYRPEEFNSELLQSIILEVAPRGDVVGLSAQEASDRVRTAGLKEWRADICIRTRSGDIRWFSDTSVQLLNSSGVPYGSLGILQDITERKRAEEALRQSEERYRRTITEAGAVPYQRTYGDESTFTFIGEGIERITGYRPEELTIKLWLSLIQEIVMLGEADGLPVEDAVRKTRAGEIQEWRADVLIRARTGEFRWISDTSIQLSDSSGRTTGSLGILVDITERKRAEQALRESEERYALVAQAANDGLWDWNLEAGTIYYGPRWTAMLGESPETIGSVPEEWFRRVHPEDLDRLKQEIESHFLPGSPPEFQFEYRILHADGAYRWMLCRGLVVRKPDGQACRVAGSHTDVTERHMAQQQLLHDALHDALTGLPNRVLLKDRLEQAISRCRRRSQCGYAVIFLDLDRFKVINDSLGHLEGDLVLQTIARRLQTCVRPGDTVARFAGDEFTVLLEDLRDPDDTRMVADRILGEISQPINLEGQIVYTTVSMGIVLGTPDYRAPDELLRDADIALYRAKAAGKARYAVFDPSMHATALAAFELESELRKAVADCELVLHYQPILSLESGRISAVEALVRWNHPVRGMISPAAFIPIAEETGLIVPLGWWIIEEAFRQLKEWQTQLAGQLSLLMCINLSARQFSDPEMLSRLTELASITGIDPGSVAFEITESVMMENPTAKAYLFEQLRTAGFHLHLDDFGTGYSSFSYLHQFPITTLKIDRSFIAQMTPNSKEANITRSIIQLGSNLGLKVTAEGVERPEQLEFLQAAGCTTAQGWLIARPAPAAEIGELLATNPQW